MEVNVLLQGYTHWIFDMDGTLTMPVHDFDSIRAELGVEEGHSILEAIEKMNERQAAKIKTKLAKIETDLAYQALPQPDIEFLLTGLINLGCKVGILTRNDEQIAHQTLRAAGLDSFFEDKVVIGRETCKPKPDPAGVLYLMKMWGATAESTLIVGDYLHDLKAGYEAGITTVHFDSSEIYPWPKYTDHRVASMKQLLAMTELK
ncbi:MAG: HAD family hydrolase [Gammaproteobacteria bacterium]|nr:HAD family hydrolase [Gammaproteobacteria bacterium]